MLESEVVFCYPPGENNPRNSEGSFISLSDHEIIFVYSSFIGDVPADHADCNICLIRSLDDGKTWSKPKVILRGQDEDAMNIMSLTLLHMKDGSIGMFYLVRKALTLIRLYVRRSYDGGRTWEERKCCISQQGTFVVNNDRAIRLSDGRIIVPIAFHHSGFKNHPDEDPNEGFVENHADTVFFISDDDGDTFHMTHKCMLPYHAVEGAGLQEPGLIELKNGTLWAWARTSLGRQYEMFSVYRGERWTTPQPSRFTSPLSPLSMRRTPQGDLLAVWNPIATSSGQTHSPYGRFTGRRTPLAAAVSHDDGLTFSNPYPLEIDPKSGYCYTAIHFHGDAVLLAYCAEGLVELRCRRYILNELVKACDEAEEDIF